MRIPNRKTKKRPCGPFYFVCLIFLLHTTISAGGRFGNNNRNNAELTHVLREYLFEKKLSSFGKGKNQGSSNYLFEEGPDLSERGTNYSPRPSARLDDFNRFFTLQAVHDSLSTRVAIFQWNLVSANASHVTLWTQRDGLNDFFLHVWPPKKELAHSFEWVVTSRMFNDTTHPTSLHRHHQL